MTAEIGLLERENELAALTRSLEDIRTGGGGGGALLIEGVAGVGKTALLEELRTLAVERGCNVLGAQGSTMEREFGFGVVRQLLGSAVQRASAEHDGLLEGAAWLAAPIFGLASPGEIESDTAEASLYGLFWLVAGLAERAPLVLSIDDAHWCDAASLRFVEYLCRRLADLPVLLVLAARPNETDEAARMLRSLTTALDLPALRPTLLSEAATSVMVRGYLGEDATGELLSACFHATGGNPLLIRELLVQLREDREAKRAVDGEGIAAMGVERIAAGLTQRALELDVHGASVLQAAAVLGDASAVAAVAALAEVEPRVAATIVDGLTSTSILAPGPRRRFAHPLLQSAVYNDIPPATRAMLHARAAWVLATLNSTREEIAAQVLLCEPGSSSIDAAGVLDAAARTAAEQGAPESAAVYLRRAVMEVGDDARRAELLHRLGDAELASRDSAAIEHLQQALELTDQPQRAIDIYLQLTDVLSMAGLWEPAIQAVGKALERFGQSNLPGVMDMEAAAAASRFYDPKRVIEYDRDRPRLHAIVEGRFDEESQHLRWFLAASEAVRSGSTAAIVELLGTLSEVGSMRRRGRETSFVGQAVTALLMIEAYEEGQRVASSLFEEGRRRGSVLATIFGLGLAAGLDSGRGNLTASETSLNAAIELIEANQMSVMALTTIVNFCHDTVIERASMAELAGKLEELELPPSFAATQSGGLMAETRGVLRMAGGDCDGAVAEFRRAGEIYTPIQAGPRMTRWRSRLALALPQSERAESLELARQELELAVEIESAKWQGVALRAIGLVAGDESGLDHLRQSVSILRESTARLELARSLAELGAALRRGNQRVQARECLREAGELAQGCGAERLARRVEEELRIAGAKPRRRALSGIESLTPGERRVVDAAAGGATNRQIAQNLFVTLRTVEMHLTNAYRKLGASSREELAELISSRS